MLLAIITSSERGLDLGLARARAMALCRQKNESGISRGHGPGSGSEQRTSNNFSIKYSLDHVIYRIINSQKTRSKLQWYDIVVLTITRGLCKMGTLVKSQRI